MRIVLAALFLPFLILTNWLNVKAQDWRQIVPLKSTRAEVERLLGSTTGAYFAQYELSQGLRARRRVPLTSDGYINVRSS